MRVATDNAPIPVLAASTMVKPLCKAKKVKKHPGPFKRHQSDRKIAVKVRRAYWSWASSLEAEWQGPGPNAACEHDSQFLLAP